MGALRVSTRSGAVPAVVAAGLAVAVSGGSWAGTVARYRFEEGEGQEFAGGIEAVRDSSRNDLHGTCWSAQGAAYTAALAPDGDAALRFNGRDDWVFVPDCPKLQLTKSLTTEAWVNIRALQTNGAVNFILFRGDNRPGWDAFWLAVNPHTRELVFGIEGPGKPPGPPPMVKTRFRYLGQTIHVAGVLDDADGFLGLFVNGELVDSTRTPTRPWRTLDPRERPGLGIGGYFAELPGSFTIDGAIDEVRITDRALTPQQFLCAPRSLADEPERAAWWWGLP